MNFRFLSPAFDELQSSIEFYRNESSVLGDRFAVAVESALKGIRQNPKACAVVDLDMRRRVMTSFPYSIIYRINGDEIVVSAIAHTSRDPKSYLGRI